MTVQKAKEFKEYPKYVAEFGKVFKTEQEHVDFLESEKGKLEAEVEVLSEEKSVNETLNLDDMDKDQLEQYGRDQLGIELDKRKSKENLIKEIREHEHS